MKCCLFMIACLYTRMVDYINIEMMGGIPYIQNITENRQTMQNITVIQTITMIQNSPIIQQDSAIIESRLIQNKSNSTQDKDDKSNDTTMMEKISNVIKTSKIKGKWIKKWMVDDPMFIF